MVENCLFCRQQRPVTGEGLLIRGYFICAACEAKITLLYREDPDYDFYLNGLKKIWHSPGDGNCEIMAEEFRLW
ncbi:MAG: sigma-G inhibitor, Gin [Peptococcaceae bacterium]|nr:MAG: sigma-G inhibitor, Gin [Peptococcaceae bacterium]